MRKGNQILLAFYLSGCVKDSRKYARNLSEDFEGQKCYAGPRRSINLKSRQKRTGEENIECLPLCLLICYLKEGKRSGVKMLFLFWIFQ